MSTVLMIVKQCVNCKHWTDCHGVELFARDTEGCSNYIRKPTFVHVDGMPRVRPILAGSKLICPECKNPVPEHHPSRCPDCELRFEWEGAADNA